MSLRLTPYLVMDGNAREAIAFYERALGGKVVTMQTYGEMAGPSHSIPDSAKERIGHALLRFGDSDLMFSDTFPGQPHQIGNQVTVAIITNSTEETKRIFEALAQGGQIGMDLHETAWSPAYGDLTDKFGVGFQINTEAKQ
jgi:PhnB protein